MSRSKPNISNPCQRWMEWKGGDGTIVYYDKEQEENIEVPLPFRFLLLDTLATVRGWHEGSQSGIYSNEVRSTKNQPLTVKSFNGGILADGLYQAIKDKVKSVGGKFTQNCYIAFDNDGELTLGSLQFKGAALNAWIEFSQNSRNDIYEKAIVITGSTEGKKGAVTFKVPTFAFDEVSAVENDLAKDIDKELQEFLKTYAAKKEFVPEEPSQEDSYYPDDDEVPF